MVDNYFYLRRMLDLNIRDLIDLIDANCQNNEDRIQKMYQWDFDKTKLICQISIGISVSFLVLIGTSYFQNITSAKPILISWDILVITIFFALCPAGYGIFHLYRLTTIHRQYVIALKLLHQIREIQPFITRYRQQM